MLIKAINSVNSFNNFALNIILKRIKIILKGFEKAECFHTIWELNNLVDVLANKACLLL